MNPLDAFSILHAPASEEDIALLLEAAGPLPEAYLDFLRCTDGAEGSLIQPEGHVVRLDSIRESVRTNQGYEIQESLPQLWMIGSDAGDYGICFDRQGSPDQWPVVEVPLGAKFADELFTIAPSFAVWQETGFAVVHGWSPPDDRELYLVLDAIGPSIARIASIVAEAAGLSAAEALALVRLERPVLLKTTTGGRRRLERLHAGLTRHGASASIHSS